VYFIRFKEHSLQFRLYCHHGYSSIKPVCSTPRIDTPSKEKPIAIGFIGVALSVTNSAKTIVFFYNASHGAGLWLIATATM
jgi:hypothetical protein